MRLAFITYNINHSGRLKTVKVSYQPAHAGPVAHSVASPTADSGVVSLIPAQSHTFVELDHEIILFVT